MKTLLAATLVTLALSLSATIAEAGGVREVIPPAQQHYNAQPEGANAVVPGAGREVIPTADQRG